jgi:hypothetical protein
MDVDPPYPKNPRLRTFARNLFACLQAHRLRVSFRTALEKWTPDDVDEGYYWLAESLERMAYSKMSINDLEKFYRDDPPGDPAKPVQ